MIVCPNCNHQNPEGSTQCENCYTPLPQTTSCPNCGASVQTDATFCGQCGFNLQVEMIEPVIDMSENLETYPELTYTEEKESLPSLSTEAIAEQNPWDENNSMAIPQEEKSWQQEVAAKEEVEEPQFAVSSPWDSEEPEELPDLSESDGLLDLVDSIKNSTSSSVNETKSTEELFSSTPSLGEELKDVANQEKIESTISELPIPEPPISKPPIPKSPISASPILEPPISELPEPQIIVSQPQLSNPVVSELSSATQLQLQNARLLHVQTNNSLQLASNLAVVHIGKPNSQIPPDIDVSGFANSDVVSRIHADIRVEGDAYFIEDVGSSNGTYINHIPLLVGNRHRLRSGDRISLGKGDLVTFIFQLSA